ncbi:hypothetical protein HGRIS_001640 [Hohenbuehelia grisea]|uniref:Uncharacterized protein n=1 Tax=Hohenbuehelia grisea TaxID=104357 RepID=A0ABR3JIZ0_9AGAR
MSFFDDNIPVIEPRLHEVLRQGKTPPSFITWDKIRREAEKETEIGRYTNAHCYIYQCVKALTPLADVGPQYITSLHRVFRLLFLGGALSFDLKFIPGTRYMLPSAITIFVSREERVSRINQALTDVARYPWRGPVIVLRRTIGKNLEFTRMGRHNRDIICIVMRALLADYYAKNGRID